MCSPLPFARGTITTASGTLPAPSPAALALLVGAPFEGVEATARATRLPVVGIGGIDASNAAEVIRAGATGVAVVSSVGAAKDPVSSTRELVAAVREAKGSR